jgi:hypothetical protein
MIARRREELKLVEVPYGQLELGPNCDWFVIQNWSLGDGWNKTQIRVLVQIPPGYPTTQPDNFFCDSDLRLKCGAQPGNTSYTNIQNLQWLQFSYHFVDIADWQPHSEIVKGHNMLTFLQGINKRLMEIN